MKEFEKNILGNVDIKRFKNTNIFIFKGINFCIKIGKLHPNNLIAQLRKIKEERDVIIATCGNISSLAICNPSDKFNKRVGIRVAIIKCYITLKKIEIANAKKEIEKYSLLLDKKRRY